jgi:replicative DNA helicase
MDKTKSDPLGLHIQHISSVTKEALERISLRRDSIQDYVKTRWSKLNRVLLGGIQFSSIYVIAGLMGTGKSYVRMLLQQDAFNRELNKDCIIDYVWLHFNFEMNASSEVIRMLATELGLNFNTLLSVEEILPENTFEYLKQVLADLENLPVYTCDVPGSVNQLFQTIYKFKDKEEIKGKRLIISIDHTLLVQKLNEPDENRVMAALAQLAIRLKKELGAAVILLSQLKTSLQTTERRRKENHYPLADDIFGSKTIPQAADFILILNRPELLNLDSYGLEAYPTDGLLAFHIVKNRDGFPGLIRMKHDLSRGLIRQWTDQDDIQNTLNHDRITEKQNQTPNERPQAVDDIWSVKGRENNYAY